MLDHPFDEPICSVGILMYKKGSCLLLDKAAYYLKLQSPSEMIPPAMVPARGTECEKKHRYLS